ncbi:hypothetical protein GCM10010406_49590 [Streptomyces thermolineatus]|uniref:Uncharacterized protein n=1 Tax=Streptomyces thermolineatus TaxID=44033 RepID=A0ABN3MSK7_9ACTN
MTEHTSTTGTDRPSTDRFSTGRPSTDRFSTGRPSTGSASPEHLPDRDRDREPVPDPGSGRSREQGRARPTRTAHPDDPAPPGGRSGSAGETSEPDRLLPHDVLEQAESRLRQVKGGFVDSPQRAVEEADALLGEVSARLAEALAERRRALRDGWQGREGAADTEHLRLVLQQYRDLFTVLARA